MFNVPMHITTASKSIFGWTHWVHIPILGIYGRDQNL